LVPTSIHAQEELSSCKRALKDYRLSNTTTTFRVEGDESTTKVVFRPTRPEAGLFFQENLFFGSKGRVSKVGVDRLYCDAEALMLKGMSWQDGGEEVFDPPLPWLQGPLPLKGGHTWRYRGTLTIKTPDDRAAQTFDIAVTQRTLPEEVLKTALGAFKAIPVHYQLTLSGAAEPVVEMTTWYINEAGRFQMVKRVRKQMLGPGEAPKQITWTLVSIEDVKD